MAVMMRVAIIVAKHATVIDPAKSRIYVSQAIFHNLAGLVPYFFSQNRAPPFAGQIQSFVNSFFGRAASFMARFPRECLRLRAYS